MPDYVSRLFKKKKHQNQCYLTSLEDHTVNKQATITAISLQVPKPNPTPACFPLAQGRSEQPPQVSRLPR